MPSSIQTQSSQQSSRARTDDAKKAVRERILREAKHLYAEVGYDQFSMRKLAKKIGYTATTIYGYFENKDSLLDALIEEGFAAFVPALLVDTQDARSKILNMADAYVEFAYNDPELYDLMFVRRPEVLQAVDPVARARRRSLLTVIAAAVHAAENEGAIDPEYSPSDQDLMIADALWGMVHGLVTLHYSQPDYTRAKAQAALRAAMEKFIPKQGKIK